MRKRCIWIKSVEQNSNFREALDQVNQLAKNRVVLSLSEISRKHKIDLKELWKAWRWESKSDDIRYYSDPSVQESIFEATQKRNVKLGEDGQVVRIEKPEDVFLLAVFMNTQFGINEHPSFYRSLVWSVPDELPEGWDITIQVDGRGDKTRAAELMHDAISAISELEIEITVFDEGISSYTCVISNHQKEGNLLKLINKQLNTHMKEPEAVKLLDETEFTLVPRSLNPFTAKPCVPIPINEL